MRVTQLFPDGFINRKVLGISMRVWMPLIILALAIGGLFSPLFDLSRVHGVGNPKLYFQHFYFDFIAGLGGYWAATFCKHWYHRVPLFIFIDVLTTFALVTIIG
jgi:hypothetical protein